ncbi:centrosomal AT-AC splicing factor-like [Littorina saxatilis]|uniref:centrosomal AT-AC splicing factor-like n=1 Tax=Littorina saxatilis TaxID=31220 RepID=UPI0038B4A185
MHAFFWENWIPAGQKVDFFISREDAVRFYENAEKAVERYLKKEKHKMIEERDKIRAADQVRQAVKWTGIQQELVRSSSVGRDEPVALSSVSVPKDSRTAGSVGKKTLSAFGHGLTYISASSLEEGGEESKGNIYTGATPPWLIEDGLKGNGEIGPTAATFSQYLKNLQKQKLPACRVGAEFNRTVNTTTQWLPAFGRVWSNGRRLGSKNQFLMERKRTKARGMRTPDTPVIPSTSLHSSSLGCQEQVTQLQASSTITSNNVRSSGGSFYPRSSVSGCEGVYANTQHSTEPPLPVACSIKSCSTACATSSKTLPSATPVQLHQPHTSATITITTRGSRDSKVSADSRPYKRQRSVQTALAPQATSLIPVTSKLLSVPSKTSKSS